MKWCRFVDMFDKILINQLLIQMSINQLPYILPLYDCKQIVQISIYFPLKWLTNYKIDYQLI